MRHARVSVIGLLLSTCILAVASAGNSHDEIITDEQEYDVDEREADEVAEQVIHDVDGVPHKKRQQVNANHKVGASLAETEVHRKDAPHVGIIATPNGLAVAPPKEMKPDALHEHIATEVTTQAAVVDTEIENADALHTEATTEVAQKAAVVANAVAAHSLKIVGHAQHVLKHALSAVHDARKNSVGLDTQQKASLNNAEAHLLVATNTAEYGKLKTAKDLSVLRQNREHMLEDIQKLREEVKAKNQDDSDVDKAIDDLEADIQKSDGSNHDELKAELDRLTVVVHQLETAPEHDQLPSAKPTPGGQAGAQDAEDVEDDNESSSGSDNEGNDYQAAPTPIEHAGVDIDTQMPYGELEPFGREDTAQELTESSIRESDMMVDQIERAETAEEQRAVFRALTRLRGAAIASFDGIARAQTGNMDEYNKVHKWRKAHPLAHLADEESDVSTWAFPSNAD